MSQKHVFTKPVIRYSEIVQINDSSCISIVTRRKVLQKDQILEKLKGVVYPGSVFQNGIRPRDLADLLDIPQSTVRKFLREYVNEGTLSVNVVSSRESFYKPVQRISL